MDLINKTRHAAHCFRGVLDEDLIFATLVVRAGYQVEGGVAKPRPPDLEPVREDDEEICHSLAEGDGAPAKVGIDVSVFGSAYATGGPVTQMDVSLSVG